MPPGNIPYVYNSGFRHGGGDPVGVVCLFSEVARASDKNIHNYFYSRLYVSYLEPFLRSPNTRTTW